MYLGSIFCCLIGMKNIAWCNTTDEMSMVDLRLRGGDR
jgi:hypothetical protein